MEITYDFLSMLCENMAEMYTEMASLMAEVQRLNEELARVTGPQLTQPGPISMRGMPWPEGDRA